mmetsp:Transcript_18302/g.37365  ORF Transcript_18302/g.37365 Transcript_18302/m.37365 type:complete len:238 (+) Transcript_18302:294-1007(+)
MPRSDPVIPSAAAAAAAGTEIKNASLDTATSGMPPLPRAPSSSTKAAVPSPRAQDETRTDDEMDDARTERGSRPSSSKSSSSRRSRRSARVRTKGSADTTRHAVAAAAFEEMDGRRGRSSSRYSPRYSSLPARTAIGFAAQDVVGTTIPSAIVSRSLARFAALLENAEANAASPSAAPRDSPSDSGPRRRNSVNSPSSSSPSTKSLTALKSTTPSMHGVDAGAEDEDDAVAALPSRR